MPRALGLGDAGQLVDVTPPGIRLRQPNGRVAPMRWWGRSGRRCRPGPPEVRRCGFRSRAVPMGAAVKRCALRASACGRNHASRGPPAAAAPLHTPSVRVDQEEGRGLRHGVACSDQEFHGAWDRGRGSASRACVIAVGQRSVPRSSRALTNWHDRGGAAGGADPHPGHSSGTRRRSPASRRHRFRPATRVRRPHLRNGSVAHGDALNPPHRSTSGS